MKAHADSAEIKDELNPQAIEDRSREIQMMWDELNKLKREKKMIRRERDVYMRLVKEFRSNP